MYFVSAPLKSVIVHAISVEAIYRELLNMYKCRNSKESTELCIAWQALQVNIYNG